MSQTYSYDKIKTSLNYNQKGSKMKNTIIIILLLSLVFGMGGCLLPFPQPLETPAPTDISSDQTPVKPIDPNWAPIAGNGNNQPLPSIVDVVEKTFSSVVAINTEIVTIDFFQRQRTQSGAGSGWIIDGSGIIVTNNHVIDGAKTVTVETVNGRTFQTGPENIYRDPVTDLAIVKINATDLPAVPIGNSTKLRVGEWVVALGNPLGQGLRAKEGTISGINVSLTIDAGQSLYELIETSAAINPGNSGGPLMNMKGEVIGITSAKIAAVGVEGMGYAISTHTALPIIEELITKGYVTRPWLGVQLYTVDQYVATINRLPVDKGVVITYIVPNSPAEKVGLQELDVITHFNNKEVVTAVELIQAIHASEIGEEVKLTFVRGQDIKKTTARLTQNPAPVK